MDDLEGALWLEPSLRELVRVRTAQLTGCATSLARHAGEAIELGESPRRLAVLSTWRRSSLFTDRERAALELAEAVALLPGGRAVASTGRRAASRFEERELAQLVFACVAANASDRLELAIEGIERSTDAELRSRGT